MINSLWQAANGLLFKVSERRASKKLMFVIQVNDDCSYLIAFCPFKMAPFLRAGRAEKHRLFIPKNFMLPEQPDGNIRTAA